MVSIIGRFWSSVPGFAKVLLAVQAVVIVVLSGWTYNEYLNNQYLQAYLFSMLDGRGSFLAVMGFGGLVGTVLVGILLRAGNILGEIENLSGKVETGSDAATLTMTRPAEMPVLKIANREPRGEIGQLHGSMQRWKERSSARE